MSIPNERTLRTVRGELTWKAITAGRVRECSLITITKLPVLAPFLSFAQ